MYLKQILTFLLAAVALTAVGQQLEIEQPVRFLALGDSYTIGQSVSVDERWPEQLADSLEAYDYGVAEVDIIAVTGWTTGNLINALDGDTPDSNYTLVSLLIGVNNQYQGRDIEEYAEQFESLLNRALAHAQGIESHVFVLSIPDYAFTPFGGGSETVTEEIDAFNDVNRNITEDYGITYINITDISRRGLDEPELVASDGLHPSGAMYAEWVGRILDAAGIGEVVSTKNINQSVAQNIYPNPVGDDLYLELDLECTYIIYGSDSSIIQTGGVVPGGAIDVSGLKAGNYVVQFRTQNKVQTETFIKL